MDRGGYGQYNNFDVPLPNYQQMPNKPGNYNEPTSNYSKPRGGYDPGHRGERGLGGGGGVFWNDRQGNLYGTGGASQDNYNKGYGGSNGGKYRITQEDTIFVSGMNPTTTEQDIETHFGAIGIIKKDKHTMQPKIWLYKDKRTGISKGEATITYDDANAAQSSIQWFDGKDFNGCVIKVSLAQRQNNWKKGAGGSRGAGGFRGRTRGGAGGGNVQLRDGDWKCDNCNNTNFARRLDCYRCQTPKGDDGNSSGSGFGGGGNYGGGGGGYSRFNNDNSGRGGRGNGGMRSRPY